MSDHAEPRNQEEYIRRVEAEAEKMKDEHVPSHSELIK